MTAEWPLLAFLMFALQACKRKRTIEVPDWVPPALIPESLTPSSAIPASLPAPKPWPSSPSATPAFPGPEWEFDRPPPAAVVARAKQLVSTLWKRGKGAHVVEKTGGRWIAYQAQKVASGRNGVVAYRLKSERPRPPVRATPRPAVIPTAPPIRATPRLVSQPKNVRPTLRKGAGLKPRPPNSNVKLVQRKVGARPVDGRFGNGTERAVKDYQTQHGLKPDGVVGPKTWAKLSRGGLA